MGSVMKNIIHSIDTLFNLEKSKINLLPMQVDTYRRLFSLFINYESISKIVLTIDNLKKSFEFLLEDIDTKTEPNRIVCLDTSEILSSVYPGYKWYFSLKTMFSKPKAYRFFITPWFFIETLDTLKNKINRSLNNPKDNNIVKQLSFNPNILEFKNQFSVQVKNHHLYIKENKWDNNELELNFLNTVSEIGKNYNDTYLGHKIKYIINQNIFNSATNFELINSVSDYANFAKELNKNNTRYINFRDQLVKMRSYNMNSGYITSEKLIKNANTDTVSFGFLDWLVKRNKQATNEIALLSRDSFFQNINKWRKIGESALFCHNVQSLYLQWANINSPLSSNELKQVCFKTIDSLKDISLELKGIIGNDSINNRMESINRILFWFKKNRMIKIINSDIMRSVEILSETSQDKNDKKNAKKYLYNLFRQEDYVSENIEKYASLSEKILTTFKQIESINEEENFRPLFEDVNKWAGQFKSTYKDYKKIDPKLQALKNS